MPRAKSTRPALARLVLTRPALMEGEDPSSMDPRDARDWIRVYDQLIAFKLRILDNIRREIRDLKPQLRREVNQDIVAIEDQLERYRVRLDFWYRRHFEIAGLMIDHETRTVSHRGAEVQLTGREYQLLHVLLRHPERYYTSRQLVLEAWHDPLLSGEELRGYIGALRRKLKQINLGRIVNRPGSGYALRFED